MVKLYFLTYVRTLGGQKIIHQYDECVHSSYMGRLRRAPKIICSEHGKLIYSTLSGVAAYLLLLYSSYNILWCAFIHVKILEWNVNKSTSHLYIYAPKVVCR